MKFALVLIALVIMAVALGLSGLRHAAPVEAAGNVIKQVVTPHAVTQWEHGWKTHRVTATRYSNTNMGFNIGFQFPLNPNDDDRAEISDFIDSKNGSIYQIGGYPGAGAFATFEGVTDVASADKKLQAILPELDKLMDDITDGKKIKPFKPVEPELTMAQWIDKMNAKKTKCTDGEGSGSNGYDSWSFGCENGVEVYKDTTKESQEWEAKDNAHKAQLANALVSRCLTAQEFAEVTALGYEIYVRPMESFREEDVQSRFNAALQTQQILRQRCPLLTTSN